MFGLSKAILRLLSLKELDRVSLSLSQTAPGSFSPDSRLRPDIFSADETLNLWQRWASARSPLGTWKFAAAKQRNVYVRCWLSFDCWACGAMLLCEFSVRLCGDLSHKLSAACEHSYTKENALKHLLTQSAANVNHFRVWFTIDHIPVFLGCLIEIGKS